VLAAPTLTVDLLRAGANNTGLPVLDASGNWQWVVTVTPDAALFASNPPNGTGGSLATEIGFQAATPNGNLVSITKNATNFPNDDPGTALGATFPAGPGAVKGTAAAANGAVMFLGSDFFTTATAKQAVIITTKGPSTAGSLSSNLTWSGAYGAGSNMGRIAQGAGNPGGGNFDTYSGSLTKTVLGGDINLNGTVNISDFGILQTSFNQSGKHWQDGDLNGNGTVNITDFGILQTNFNQSLPPAPGAGGGAAVPEPGSLVLLAIGTLFIVAGRGKLRR
jgi:hypothetical protein